MKAGDQRCRSPKLGRGPKLFPTVALLLVLHMTALTAGCGCRKEETAEPRTHPQVKIDPKKPEDTLYQQLRAGSIQLAGVVETLEASLERVKAVKIGGDESLKAGISDVAEGIDSAGAAIADYQEEPPDRAEFNKRFAELDDRRLKAIEAANDSLHGLAETQGLIDAILAAKDDSSLREAADLIDVAIEDLGEAITTMGGQIEQ